MSQKQSGKRIAYLTGEYPAVSHTFILREVLALRAAGWDILTCAVRPTPSHHHRGPDEKAAAAETFYVAPAAKNPVVLLTAQFHALRQPGRYLSALALAFRIRPPGLRAFIYQLLYFLEATVLARHLKENGVEHLHNHFGNSSCSVAMLASEVSGIPFSFTLHGSAIFFEPRIWRIDEKIARARFVACISNFCRSQGMIFASMEHWQKMHVVHCAITPELYGKGREENGLQAVFVGRLAAVKGLPQLIEAFTKVVEDYPSARLKIVGDGGERRAIERLARGTKLEGHIEFTGYLNQEEVALQLRGSTVFVLPSFAEGLPVVLMEAMASELPVVASRVTGIPELIEDGKSGLLVTPGVTEELGAALGTLFGDAALRKQMGEAGRRKVVAEFDSVAEAKWLGTLLSGNARPGQLRPDDTKA
ncbi:MAG: glycosyltransferase family 4 protein [Pseudomonadota bacterium]